MPVGTVKWFDCKKGFGFIVSAEQEDIFVHYTNILGDGFRRLRDGEKVEYELTTGHKGLAAKWVKRLEPQADTTTDSDDSPDAVKTGSEPEGEMAN